MPSLRWNPDAIVFNSSHLYGTPSYWVQRFFTESSGATLLNATLQKNSATSLVSSAITWKNSENGQTYIRIKVCNGFMTFYGMFSDILAYCVASC